jgi:CMP-N,N'-diacetyllegionaminic acid synthase
MLILRSNGMLCTFLEEYELSNDAASSWDVVKEVIGRYKDLGIEVDMLALL